MKIKNWCILLCPLVLMAVFVLTSWSIKGYAELKAGGQVITNGQISFYEETTETSSSIPQSNSESISDSTIGNLVEKPTKGKGVLPSTGEFIQRHSVFLGGLLLFSVLIFYWKKPRRVGQS